MYFQLLLLPPFPVTQQMLACVQKAIVVYHILRTTDMGIFLNLPAFLITHERQIKTFFFLTFVKPKFDLSLRQIFFLANHGGSFHLKHVRIRDRETS